MEIFCTFPSVWTFGAFISYGPFSPHSMKVSSLRPSKNNLTVASDFGQFCPRLGYRSLNFENGQRTKFRSTFDGTSFEFFSKKHYFGQKLRLGQNCLERRKKTNFLWHYNKLNLNIPGTWMAALAQRAKIESNFIFVEFFESG